MKLIRIADGQYPMYMSDVAQANPNISFGPNPTDAELHSCGFARVQPGVVPSGDVTFEVAPSLDRDTGVYTEVWQSRPFNAAEIEAQAMQARDAAFSAGMPWTFDGVEQHVQIRDRDQTFLLALSNRAQQAHGAGVTDPVFTFRTQENRSFPLTPMQAIEMTNAAFDYVYNILNAAWVAKDSAE